MPIRNFRPDLNGVLVVDKPLGWTSARVCSHVRWITRRAKVGHAGTLDPLATGVLVLCLGRATKSIERIQATRKIYTAEIELNGFMTSDDLEGQPLAAGDLDPAGFGIELTAAEEAERSVEPPNRQRLERVLDSRFVGNIDQRPPDFSAVKIGGRPAYRLARAGEAPPIATKPVTIESIDVESYEPPTLVARIVCGKGTYVRSLARDLGLVLGCGGHLTGLRRDAVGEYALREALTLDGMTEEGVTEGLLPAP